MSRAICLIRIMVVILKKNVRNRNKEYFVPFQAMKKLKAVMLKHMEDQAENILLLIHSTCL